MANGTEGDLALPPGYQEGPADTQLPLPEGYVEGPAGQPAGAFSRQNIREMFRQGISQLAGLPHTLATTAGNIFGGLGQSHPLADWIAQHTYSPEESYRNYLQAGQLGTKALGWPEPSPPYRPQTAGERYVQAAGPAAVMAPLALATGGMAAAPIIGATLGGPLAQQAATDVEATPGYQSFRYRYPNLVPEGALPAAANIAGTMAGGGFDSGLNLAGQYGRRFAFPSSSAEAQVADEIARAGGGARSLATNISQNRPTWTPGTEPTTAEVTDEPRLASAQYAVQSRDPAEFQRQRLATNVAQRAAISGVTPDTAPILQTLEQSRTNAVNAMPPGQLSLAAAGQQFRTVLQNEYDRLAAERAKGGSMFDALENSPAQINLRPMMDYTVSQAAKNPGEVGEAYNRALAQFRSATGLTLDTAPFANSVLKGLGDLSGSYPTGSAARFAVNDVKSRLEADLLQQVPEVQAARVAWANASVPLDPFKAKPIAQVLAKDSYGRDYLMGNEAVARAFLQGNGSGDALDSLTKIFGTPAAATAGLQDFLAGQVRQNALNPDGSINVAALNRTLAPYQRALVRFPGLAQRFQTARGAQLAVDQQNAYQALYDKFSTGLGGQQTDTAGNSVYIPRQFNNAVEQADAAGLLDRAYGSDGAAVVRQVSDELKRISQTGTPQALLAAPQAPARGWLGGLVGTIGGALLERFAEGSSGAAGAIAGGKAGEALTEAVARRTEQFQGMVEQFRRQALLDPEFARNLMIKYDPRLPTTQGQRAFNYVMQRLPGPIAGQTIQPPQQLSAPLVQ
jgi:hypothetical protein